MKKVLILLLSICSIGCDASLRDAWFCPTNTDLLNNKVNTVQWESAAKRVSNFKFYHGLIRNIPDNILVQKVNSLNELGIKTSIELPILIGDKVNGSYIEGFHNKTYVEFLMKKLKRLNVNLDSVVIDESIYYGFYKNKGPEDIESNIDELVKQSSSNIKIIKKYYPEVKFNIVEPIQLFKGNDFSKIFTLYYQDMKKINDVSISSVQDDIYWDKYNAHTLKSTVSELNDMGVYVGVIINSSINAKNDVDWVRSSIVNMNKLIATGVFRSSKVYPVFQSWNSFPQKTIPETNELTQTHSIDLFYKSLNQKSW